MPTLAGPNTFGEENLVFGYDLGDVSNSYKGVPVENYIHGQNAVYQDTYTSYEGPGSNASWIANHPYAIRAYNAAGGDITGYVNTGVGSWQTTHHAHWQHDPILEKPVVVMNDVSGNWKAKSFGTGMGSWNSYGKGYGDTYTISWLQWVDNLSKNAKAGLYCRTTAGTNGFHDGQANSPSSYNTKLRTWQRVYQTYTTSSVRDLDSTYLSIYMYGHYNVRGTVKIADVQFNWGSYPAQFHNGAERTVTEGLLDLTGNSTIDLTNVSFDSNAQMTFDGTNDSAPIGTTSALNITNAMSVFAWIKPDSISGWKGIFGGATSGFIHFQLYSGGLNCYVYGPNAGYDRVDGSPTCYVSAGQWAEVGMTFGNNTLTMYINGVAMPTTVTGNGSNISSNSDVRIGWSYSTDRLFQGSIENVKVYNRALTASEIQQNFNAIKGRFNI